MEFTEALKVYRPASAVGPDKNVVPAAVVPVATLMGNMQRGSKGAQDTATQLGIYDRQNSICFFPIGSEKSLGDRYVLKDEVGALWLIRSGPLVRNRWPATAHVWAFCTNLAIPPTGI
jgi:hypothetical protein